MGLIVLLISKLFLLIEKKFWTCQCNGLEGPSNHACLVNIAVQITQIHTHIPVQNGTILLFSKHSSTYNTDPFTYAWTAQYNSTLFSEHSSTNGTGPHTHPLTVHYNLQHYCLVNI